MKLNFIAPIGITGYGIVAENLLTALLAEGIDISWFPTSHSNVPSAPNHIQLLYWQNKGYSPSAPCYKLFHEWDQATFPIGSGAKIAAPTFETDLLSRVSVAALNECTAVWSPTNWQTNILETNGVSPRLLKTVPNHGVSTSIFYPRNDNTNSFDPFTFIHIGKWEMRKGSDLVIRAYTEEFCENGHTEGKTGDVSLRMVSFNMFLPKAVMDIIVSSRSNEVYGIHFDGHFDTQAELADLIRRSHCGVFPSLAEGWNLPLLETMACGLPVICSDWTGHTQYINDNNSCKLTSRTKQEAYDNIFFKGGRGDWFVPNLKELRKKMREAFERGKTTVNTGGIETSIEYTWKNAAIRVKDALCNLLNIQTNKAKND